AGVCTLLLGAVPPPSLGSVCLGWVRPVHGRHRPQHCSPRTWISAAGPFDLRTRRPSREFCGYRTLPHPPCQREISHRRPTNVTFFKRMAWAYITGVLGLAFAESSPTAGDRPRINLLVRPDTQRLGVHHVIPQVPLR